MFKKKLPQWSMLPAEVEVTHFYGTLPFLDPLSDPASLPFPGPELIRYLNSFRYQDPYLSRSWIPLPPPVSV
jgi:hypothetical protein